MIYVEKFVFWRDGRSGKVIAIHVSNMFVMHLMRLGNPKDEESTKNSIALRNGFYSRFFQNDNHFRRK